MKVFSNVLLAILPLFALILLGWLGKKFKLLHATDAPVLNRLVVTITLPAFVLHALLNHHLDATFARLPLVFWLAELLVFGLALALAALFRWNRQETGTLILLSVFGNTGYIGYPVTTALLPQLLPATVIIDQIGMSVPLYPGAVVLGGIFGRSSGKENLASFLKFFKSPIMIALAGGILLQLVPGAWIPKNPAVLEAGRLLNQLLGLLAAVTIPVVLIAVGLLLRPSTLAQHSKKVVLVGALKLLALPILVWIIAKWLFHITGDLLAVCVLEGAMPPSATATVFSGEYEMDGALAVASFFALTVVSAITLPLMLSLLR